MSGVEGLKPPGGETNSAPQEPFSLTALHASIRRTLRFQLSDAADLAWIKTLDDTLSGEDPGYQAACLQAASTGLLVESLPEAAEATKSNWVHYIHASYPEDTKTGDRLPNPNRQAQDRNLDQAAVVAAHRTVTDQSKQDLLRRVKEDDPLTAGDVKAGLIKAVRGDVTPVTQEEAEQADDGFDEAMDQALLSILTRVQLEFAEQALIQCARIQSSLPVKGSAGRVGASVLKRSRLAKTPEKKDKTTHEANRAARTLVKILNELGDPAHIGALVTDTIPVDFIDTLLASHYGRMVRAAKGRLAEQLEQVPTTFAIPRATRKPRPKQPASVPPSVSESTQRVKEAANQEPDSTEEPAAEETAQAEAGKGLTPAEIWTKQLYKTALERYFELFSSKDFRKPELAQFAGVLRRTPDDPRKASLFLVLASFSGDNRAIHDAFVTIENMSDNTTKHLRSPLYGLCYQVYARTRSMPEQAVYALARQANPEAPLPDNRDEYIRPGTAFTDDAETLRNTDTAVVEVNTRVDKATLEELLGELDMLFPEPIRQATNTGIPASGERRQSTYVQLPALKETRVRSILENLGCELDLSGGKGSHIKVFNPSTETTSTLSSTKGEVNPIPLSSLLDQLGIEPEAFVQAMRGKV